MSEPTDIFSVMAVHALDVSTATAERIAAERWGIRGHARALTGERDRNFHFRAEDGREFVLKFANPVEDAGVTDMQIKVLQHIATVDPSLPVPRVIPLPDGSTETLVPHETGGIQRVRLLTWLHGEPLGHSRRSAAQRIACGQLLARLQIAMADFRHPASSHELVWDLKHALRMREIAFALPHPEANAAIASVFDAYEAQIAPLLPSLRHQVLHNDMNFHNTLVDSADHDKMGGMIDFGDTVDTAVVIDVATGSTAQFGRDMAPADAYALYLQGFHGIRKLLPEEINLLPLLSATRVAIGLSLQAWHRHIQPENPHYAPITEEVIQHRLANIATLRHPDTTRTLRTALA